MKYYPFHTYFFGKLTFLACTILFPFFIKAQTNTTFTLTTTLPGPFEFFTTDKLQQIYAVTPSNEVIKYSVDGQELFRFNNNTLGKLGHIDATDPFNLLLFYPDFQIAITLDRTMSKTGEFNLQNLGIFNVQAMATSRDNDIWLYDELNFQLKKINRDGIVQSRSEDLNLLLGQAPDAQSIEARENFVYLNAPNLGLLVFDNFGNYHKTLPIKDIQWFQVLDKQLIYQSNEQMFVFHLKALTEAPLALPEGLSPKAQIRLQKNRLYVLSQTTLNVYTF